MTAMSRRTAARDGRRPRRRPGAVLSRARHPRPGGRCQAAGDYQLAGRRVSRESWFLTSGLLRSRPQALLAPRIVPAAQRLPYRFTSIVNQVDQG
jgi:hypothetical protein